jgi:hypothetical protein
LSSPLTIAPYTLTWDGGQWVVNKTIAKSKSEGERVVLVGYYANLQHALYFGIMHDALNGGAYTTAQGAVDQMVEMWADIQRKAIPWAEAAKAAYAPPTRAKQAVGL